MIVWKSGIGIMLTLYCAFLDLWLVKNVLVAIVDRAQIDHQLTPQFSNLESETFVNKCSTNSDCRGWPNANRYKASVLSNEDNFARSLLNG